MPASEHFIVARIDGASRGNPGPAAYGIVVETSEGVRLAALSKYLGRSTNNVAEYHALLAALDYARENRHRRLKVLSDSELLVRQIQGNYKVKSANLKPLHERARRLMPEFATFSIVHVPREENREADRLANHALNTVEKEYVNQQAAKTPTEPIPGRTDRAIKKKEKLP